jgi:hypothetical protein
MSKRFVVITSMTNEQDQARITAHLKGRGGWWHWTPEAWLLKAPKDIDLDTLREEIKTVAPGCHFIIIPVDRYWASFGPPVWGKWFEESGWNAADSDSSGPPLARPIMRPPRRET